ncbi:MAG TPA: sigma-70 family RNA polymerase sigma factor, partial [Isosphaeraceae bacterium]|nr:sigma-70 family RNA polymerase sigma factor [Isosphaeraceae bacterium]
MTQANAGKVMRELEVLWTSGTLSGLSDAQLLGRFTAGGAQDAGGSAFRELVHRHGPIVMGVCRQILRHSHDADDAFQATFLVLVRKARSIQVRDSLAPWLYKVAYRTAMRARASASRYRVTDIEQADVIEGSADEAYQLDVRPLLQEELGRLPEKYRSPIVLCHLEGRSHEEAARILSWPVGTVSGRLSRGRQLLRSRLERRGVAVSSAMVSSSLLDSSRVVPPNSLVDSVVGAATGSASTTVSASVLTLTQGVLKAMLLNKLKATALVFLFVGAISGGAGVWARWQGGRPNRPQARQQPKTGIPSDIAKVSGPQPVADP